MSVPWRTFLPSISCICQILAASPDLACSPLCAIQGVSLKKGEPAALATPLRAYIASNHAQEAKSLENVVNAIDKQRATILLAFERMEAEVSTELVLSYYATLCNLANRCVFSSLRWACAFFIPVLLRFPFGSENQPSTFGIRHGKVRAAVSRSGRAACAHMCLA